MRQMHLSRIGSSKKEQVQQKTNQEWSGWNKSVPVLIFFSFFPSHESSFPKVNLKSASSLEPITKQRTPRNDLMRWSWAEPEVFQSLKWCWRRRKRQTTKTFYFNWFCWNFDVLNLGDHFWDWLSRPNGGLSEILALADVLDREWSVKICVAL